MSDYKGDCTEGCTREGRHDTCSFLEPARAVKYDDGKTDLSYMSYEWIDLHCKVRMFGAKKYSRNNWMLGFSVLRSLAAALRHIFAFMWGEDNDQESGLSHLGHASNCLEHAYHDYIYRKHNDDRYKPSK